MKQDKCVICLIARGKRVCKLNNNSLICPICCAQTRNSDCDGCRYYTAAEKYSKEKIKKQKSENFITELKPDLDEEVDRALALVDRGKIQSGEKIISELLKNHPNYHSVQYGMGVVYVMKNKYDEAIPYFDKAIDIFPYFVEAWFNKGSCHQQKLEVGEMIRAFQKVVELGDPSERYVRQAKDIINSFEKLTLKDSNLNLDEYLKSMDVFNEAFAAMEKMNIEKAIAGFKEVIKMNPQNTQSFGNLGICYGLLGQKKEALTALDKALELDPNYEPAQLNRIAITSLKDGEKLPQNGHKSVEYYKESFKRRNQ